MKEQDDYYMSEGEWLEVEEYDWTYHGSQPQLSGITTRGLSRIVIVLVAVALITLFLLARRTETPTRCIGDPTVAALCMYEVAK